MPPGSGNGQVWGVPPWGSQRRPYCGFRRTACRCYAGRVSPCRCGFRGGVGVELLCRRGLGNGKAGGYGVGPHEATAPPFRVCSWRRAIPTRGRSTGVWALSLFMPPPWKTRASISALAPGRAFCLGRGSTRRRCVLANGNMFHCAYFAHRHCA